MKQIVTEIEIHASASRVWAILTDFERFSDWNPFITRIEGVAQVGAKLSATIQPPGSRAMTFRPVILKIDPERELRWLGHLLLPGIFDGEHAFAIEPVNNDQVIFRQSEQFRGILVPLLWGKMGDKTQRGFELMNAAIKRVAQTP
jgi:hypothetical protein